jgi:Zn-dependent peptidase ImmA (M78 family)
MCHEIAHYFHDHNRFNDDSEIDTKAIEAQADFFSARILLTVVTFGERNRAILYGLNREIDQSILL